MDMEKPSDEIGIARADADELRGKALDALEFQQIRERLAARVTFLPARRLALELTPAWSESETAALQRETAEGRAVLDFGGDVDMSVRVDAADAVERAALGGVLSGIELLAVADTLDAHRRARRGVMSARRHAPALADIADGIPELHELARQVRRRIGERGQVLDDATHTLRALRSQMRRAYERVTQSLNALIQSPDAENALQDDVVSIRNDRLVVQVKAEMRGRVPGIVHDASNTGATLFVEPFSVVDMGNEWRELSLAEEREIRQVLRDISALVGEVAADIRRGSEITAALDLILARARFSYSIKGVSAEPSGGAVHATDVSGGRAMRLVNARHPLLGADAVPVNISVGPGWSTLIITGPNTGGKTVAMKTAGLLALMRQSGLQIPADEGSAMPVFDGVYADVGDQQSIEQSVSTFSSHMRNVIDILAGATPRSLVLLDELGTSTDAEEGAALAKAILERLTDGGAFTIATTHHRSVAAFAEASPGMMNASVQLDPNSLAPTYRLTLGMPGRSYAMAIAASLGLPQAVLDSAQAAIEPQYLRFEDWLTELQRERDSLQTLLRKAEQARADAETQRRRLDEQVGYLADHREDMLDAARRRMLARQDDAERKLKRAEAALSWAERGAAQPMDGVVMRRRRGDIARMRRELDAAKSAAPPPAPMREEQRALAVGDKAFVRGLNLSGVIVALSDDSAEIGIGGVRVQTLRSRLTLVEAQPQPPKAEVSLDIGPMLDSSELDIRGMRADESLSELEAFLDKAARDGFGSVRIIHGRGKGILRNAIREHLRRHPLAQSFEAEARERGGDGATLVKLA